MEEPRSAPLVTKAAHVPTGASPADVPADDIEAPAAGGIEVLPIGPYFIDRAAGASGIDEQRADAFSGSAGQVTNHRKFDLAPVRAIPIEGNPHGRALEVLPAVAPADRPGRPSYRRRSRGGNVSRLGTEQRADNRDQSNSAELPQENAFRRSISGVRHPPAAGGLSCK